MKYKFWRVKDKRNDGAGFISLLKGLLFQIYFGFVMPFDGSIEEMKEKFDKKFNRVSKSLFKQYGLE